MINSNLLSTADYAKKCGVSDTTIRKRIENKIIQADRIGGYYFIDIKKFPPQRAGNAGRPSAKALLSKI